MASSETRAAWPPKSQPAPRVRRTGAVGGDVTGEEVLLLWRALLRFRSGRRPLCAPRRSRTSPCPLYAHCSRWAESEDADLSLLETSQETERRQQRWPCTRLLELLDPEVERIGTRRR
jgi:hypothetical protein